MERRTTVVPIKVDDTIIHVVARVSERASSGVPGEVQVGAPLPDLSQVIKGIEVMSTALVGAVKSVAPDKTTVEFTVGLESEAGKLTALFFDGSASADLKVTLEWNGKGEGGGAH